MDKMNFGTVAAVTTAVLLLLEFSLSYFFGLKMPLALYGATLAFGILTLLIYRYLSKSNTTNPKRFVSHFMGAIGIKLFASLIFIVIYLVLGDQDSKMTLALGVMCVYMVFNILLIKRLLPEVRKNS